MKIFFIGMLIIAAGIWLALQHQSELDRAAARKQQQMENLFKEVVRECWEEQDQEACELINKIKG